MAKRKRSAPHYARKKKRSRSTHKSRYKITTLIPKTKMVQLKYCGSFTLADAISNSGHLISAIGMYDPDYTGVGHQPLGFDQWMHFYHHYEVLSSKATFWIESAGTGTSDGTYAVLRLDSDITDAPFDPILSTELESAVERPSTVVRHLKSSTAGGRVSISKSYSQAATFGRSARGNTTMKGTIAGNPTENMYYRLKLCNTLMGSSLQQHTVLFTVTYIAQLTERKDIAQS